MSLVTCPDCAREVSDAAPSCPGCGRPLHSRPAVVVEKAGLLGRPGTAWGAANFGCLMLMLGGAGLAVIVLLSSGCAGDRGESCETSQLVLVNNMSVSVTICVDDPDCNPYQDGNTIAAGDTSVRTVEPGSHNLWISSSVLNACSNLTGNGPIEVGCSSKTVTCN